MIFNPEESISRFDSGQNRSSHQSYLLSTTDKYEDEAIKFLGKNILSLKDSENNEFVNGELDPDRIDEYVEILLEYEKMAIEEKHFKDAEVAAFRVQELRKREFEFRLFQLEVQYYQEHEELARVSSIEQEEVQKAWKSRIDEITELSKTVKQNLITAHKQELKVFDKELEQTPIPKPKFSKEYLSEQSLLNGLIRTKRYNEAEVLTNKLKDLQIKEIEKWNQDFKEKLQKKRKLLLHKHKVELEALQERLDINLQEKLLQRDQDIEKLVHRFVNVKNELEHKQNQEISKLAMLYKKNKKLSKISDSHQRSMNQFSIITERNN